MHYTYARSDRGQTDCGEVALATAGFLCLSAFFHLLIVSPLAAQGYRRELSNQRSRFRWVEYSISSTLMILLIALVTGLTDLAALIGIAGANVAMILFRQIPGARSPNRRQTGSPPTRRSLRRR